MTRPHLMRLLSVVVLLASAQGLVFAQSQKMPVLDLTKKPPSDQSAVLALGLPGGSSSTSRYSLPLRISVVGVKSQETAKGPEWVVELLLTNSANIPFFLPASRDRKVHLPGNTGRRTFVFLVGLEGGNPSASNVLIGTDASRTAADSSLLIEPGKAVRVLLPITMTDMRNTESPLRTQIVNIRVGCEEWRYADDRYFIEAESDEIQSDKSVQIDLRSKKLR
jgi:hypothetical protein